MAEESKNPIFNHPLLTLKLTLAVSSRVFMAGDTHSDEIPHRVRATSRFVMCFPSRIQFMRTPFSCMM
jgi:hypothetical protein